MKLHHSIFAFVTLLAGISAHADFGTPIKVQTRFGRIYTVEGFDNNDNVQVVAEGVYNNSCYRNAETLINVNHATKTIEFAPIAYKYPGLCLEVMMPFDRVVELGVLKSGEYKIVQHGDSRILGQLRIHPTASLEPDDRMYAPISQAFVQAGPTNKVLLTGDFPLSCMKLTEVKAEIQPDVLVVLPLAEIDKSVPCNKGKYHFEVVSEIGPMKTGRYLLHVRSMNGKAVNSLFDIRQ